MAKEFSKNLKVFATFKHNQMAVDCFILLNYFVTFVLSLLIILIIICTSISNLTKFDFNILG